VLLVFAYLIVPALAGTTLGFSIGSRLLIGWGFGTLVSVVGVAASATFDLPTGATVVCVFGLTLLVGWAMARILGWMPGGAGRMSERTIRRGGLTERGRVKP
jgi:ABC-type Mn2+/Zn2+ transport system permease subunit